MTMSRSRRAARVPWVLLAGCVAILLTTSMFARASRPQKRPPVPPGTKRVLFVGNSLTYGNDLPSIVEALAKARGKNMLADAVTLGGASLEDHWNDGTARRVIARGGWDVVVLQQGPSATEGRPVLLEYGGRFAEEIRKVKAAPAYYMVWPARNRFQDFDGVSESYRMAAEAADGYSDSRPPDCPATVPLSFQRISFHRADPSPARAGLRPPPARVPRAPAGLPPALARVPDLQRGSGRLRRAVRRSSRPSARSGERPAEPGRTRAQPRGSRAGSGRNPAGLPDLRHLLATRAPKPAEVAPVAAEHRDFPDSRTAPPDLRPPFTSAKAPLLPPSNIHTTDWLVPFGTRRD